MGIFWSTYMLATTLRIVYVWSNTIHVSIYLYGMFTMYFHFIRNKIILWVLCCDKIRLAVIKSIVNPFVLYWIWSPDCILSANNTQKMIQSLFINSGKHWINTLCSSSPFTDRFDLWIVTIICRPFLENSDVYSSSAIIQNDLTIVSFNLTATIKFKHYIAVL